MGFGRENPSRDPWQGEISGPRATAWDELVGYLGEIGPRDTKASDLIVHRKQKVRRRDDHECQRRGCSVKVDPSFGPEYIGERLEVHHIITAANGGQNIPFNLITLCKSCHTELHDEWGEEVPERHQFIGPGKDKQDFFGW